MLPRHTLCLLTLPFLLSFATAQVRLTADRLTYEQNFDGLSNGAWLDNPSADLHNGRIGWYAATATGVDLTLTASAGMPQNLGRLIAFGQVGSPERAFGAVPSATSGNIFYGVRLVNQSDQTLTRIHLAYTGEQWRIGANNAVPAELRVGFAIRDPQPPTSLLNGVWQAVPALTFTGRWVGSEGTSSSSLNGNQPENRETLHAELSVIWEPGQELWIRWTDANARAVNHGLGIDNFSVTATP